MTKAPKLSLWTAIPLAAALAVAVTLLPAAPAAAQYDDEDPGYDAGYSYIRVLEGSATLFEATGDRQEATVNQPVLVGDRLWVAPRSRAELVLSDGNLLRLDADSEATFERLALSPEAGDRSTVLTLRDGNAQLVVFSDTLGDELPRIETGNATVWIREPGTYRLTAAGGDWTEVVVREGDAEVVTDRGSLVARAGEEVRVEGDSRPRASVEVASSYDELERWGQRLDRVADRSPYVDDSLRYAAAPLDDYGDWVEVDRTRVWRPRVGADWRPYWDGRWTYTPAGLTWVSSEPWGWVPYHYGTWDYAPSFGWVWYPGRRFAPSWVYWYWGPSHVAWVPVGYYTHHYNRYNGFRYGVYGWAGGDWGYFNDWSFCSTGYFGSRHQNRYTHDGRYWRNHGGGRLARGIITTDTRGLTPDRWRQPEEAIRVLRTRPGVAVRAGRGNELAELPDVTPFVARRADLPQDVVRRVAVDSRKVERLAGTPLAPAAANAPGEPDKPRVFRAGGTRDRGKTAGEHDGGARPGVAVRRVDDGAERPKPGLETRTGVRRDPADDRGKRAESPSAGRPGRPVVRTDDPARGESKPAEQAAPRSRAGVRRVEPTNPVDEKRGGDSGARSEVRRNDDRGNGRSEVRRVEPAPRRDDKPAEGSGAARGRNDDRRGGGEVRRVEPTPRTEEKPAEDSGSRSRGTVRREPDSKPAERPRARPSSSAGRPSTAGPGVTARSGGRSSGSSGAVRRAPEPSRTERRSTARPRQAPAPSSQAARTSQPRTGGRTDDRAGPSARSQRAPSRPSTRTAPRRDARGGSASARQPSRTAPPARRTPSTARPGRGRESSTAPRSTAPQQQRRTPAPSARQAPQQRKSSGSSSARTAPRRQRPSSGSAGARSAPSRSSRAPTARNAPRRTAPQRPSQQQRRAPSPSTSQAPQRRAPSSSSARQAPQRRSGGSSAREAPKRQSSRSSARQAPRRRSGGSGSARRSGGGRSKPRSRPHGG